MFKIFCLFQRNLVLVWMAFFLSLVHVPQVNAQAVSAADRLALETYMEEVFHFFYDNARVDKHYLVPQIVNVSISPAYRDVNTSVAGMGYACVAYVIGVEKGWISRAEALERVTSILAFFQSEAEHYEGFFYHFYDIETGNPAVGSEISTIDTALFLAGAMVAHKYFNDPGTSRAQSLYERVNWRAAYDEASHQMWHGWDASLNPLEHTWDIYSEQMLLYVFGMGTENGAYSVPADVWLNITRPLQEDYTVIRNSGAVEMVSYIEPSLPLFVHQYSHAYIDFADKEDILHYNYFQNSIDASLANRQYGMNLAASDPATYQSYADGLLWGISFGFNGDGNQQDMKPFTGAPAIDTDEGIVVPSAAMASLPFVPEEVLPMFYALRNSVDPDYDAGYGFLNSFNLATAHFEKKVLDIDKGTELVMMANYLDRTVWDLFMDIPAVLRGLAYVFPDVDAPDIADPDAGPVMSDAPAITPDNGVLPPLTIQPPKESIRAYFDLRAILQNQIFYLFWDRLDPAPETTIRITTPGGTVLPEIRTFSRLYQFQFPEEGRYRLDFRYVQGGQISQYTSIYITVSHGIGFPPPNNGGGDGGAGDGDGDGDGGDGGAGDGDGDGDGGDGGAGDGDGDGAGDGDGDGDGAGDGSGDGSGNNGSGGNSSNNNNKTSSSNFLESLGNFFSDLFGF